MRFGNQAQLLGLGLFALISASAASDAALLNLGNGIVNKRQDTTGAVSSGGAVNTPVVPSTRAPASTAAPSTPTPAPTSAPAASTNVPNSEEPASSTEQESNNQPSTPSTPNGGAQTSQPATQESTVVMPLVSSRTSAVTRVVTITSDGQTFESTAVSDTVEAVTTGLATSIATLSGSSGGGGGGGGLSSSSQKIIGGVVGGVGGLALIGVIVVVALRLRKRNKTNVEFEEYDANNLASEKKTTPQANQFQANLEQYHQPAARPNAAANF